MTVLRTHNRYVKRIISAWTRYYTDQISLGDYETELRDVANEIGPLYSGDPKALANFRSEQDQDADWESYG